MAKVLYHLHIDAAHLPESLLTWATQEGGFHFDDFPHQFHVNGKDLSARHLTKYITDPATPIEVKTECLQVKAKAIELGLLGFIQAEFIMQEKEWKGEKHNLPTLTPPFKLSMRPLDPHAGEEFKRHELHLELDKNRTADSVVKALQECGFHELDNPENITFTCSGHPKELGLVKERLDLFLEKHEASASGKLVYEATAFWSLHNLGPENLQKIVAKIQ